jgi:hypothetical protein
MSKYTILEGQNEMIRSLLIMRYDEKKTLTENIIEQSVVGSPNYGVSSKYSAKPQTQLTPEQKKFLKDNPNMVWDPNALDEKRYSLNKQGKTVYEKGKFVELTPENIQLRGVPFGFSPLEYPEYIKKYNDIIKKYPKKTKQRDIILSNLQKDYYRPEFWQGISKNDYLLWKKGKEKLNVEKQKEIKKHLSFIKPYVDDLKSSRATSETMPGSDRMIDVKNNFLKKIEDQMVTGGISNINDKYDALNLFIDTLFEYDPSIFKEMNKNFLIKFWEKHGLFVELVFWVVLDYFTGSVAAWLTAARQAMIFGKVFSKMTKPEVIQSIIRLAGTSGLPVYIGVDEIIKNKGVTEESVLYFMFAILPYGHKFFKIPTSPSKEVCGRIIKKMSDHNLKTTEGMGKFIKTLTETEKSLVREVFTMDKSTIENGIRKTVEGITKTAEKKLRNVAKHIKPKTNQGIKTFFNRIFVDLTAIEVVKLMFNKLGITTNDIKLKEISEIMKDFRGDSNLYIQSINSLYEYLSEMEGNFETKKIKQIIINKNKERGFNLQEESDDIWSLLDDDIKNRMMEL